MPTSDVYDVLIHFVRRDGLQDEGQREESFLQPRHQGGGVDDGGRTEEGRGCEEHSRSYETIAAGRGEDMLRLCRACLWYATKS